MRRFFAAVFLFLFLLPLCFAADTYKPYLHKPVVPEHPEVKLFGQYNTLLFPGAATYSYGVEVPKGTNGLTPTLTFSYNSQSAQGRPGILGAGWSMNQNYIYRDVNSTPTNTVDDKYVLVFENNLYELVYSTQDNQWHTEVEYYFKIQNSSSSLNTYTAYWTLTTKDGASYRFGYNTSSELTSANGYAARWYQDLTTDTYGNQITYSYEENPFAGDTGATYLRRIDYNHRSIILSYETRPDQRLVYEQGNALLENRRLFDVVVNANDTLVRRYYLNYTLLGQGISALSAIMRFGADNTSVLHTISFGYQTPNASWVQSNYAMPVGFVNSSFADTGVRLLDVNNDGFVDVVQGRNGTLDLSAWINDKSGSFTVSSSFAPPMYLVAANGTDFGVRFADINGDGRNDLLYRRNGISQVYLSTGSGWSNVSTSWTVPVDIVAQNNSDEGVQLADIDGDGRIDVVRSRQGMTGEVYLHNGAGWTNSSWSVPVILSNRTDLGVRLVDVNGDGLPDIVQANGTNATWLNTGSGWTASGNFSVPYPFLNASHGDTGVRFLDVNNDGLVDVVQAIQEKTSLYNNTWINNGTGWVSNASWLLPEYLVVDRNNTDRRFADVDGDGLADLVIANTTTTVTYRKVFTMPVLVNITNEYGGVTKIEYNVSTIYNNSDSDGLSDLGFAILVVQRVTKNNSMSRPLDATAVMNYSYANGKYNYTRKEFRGFGITTEQSGSAVVKHFFHQDNPRRSKEYQTEIYNVSGSLFSNTTKNFNYTYLYSIYNLTILSATEYQYDGLTTARVINTSYDYDWFGNPRSVIEYGDVTVTGDERTTNYTYAYNTNRWIMNKPARITVYDANNNRIKESYAYYDNLGLTGMGNTGSLTRQENWNNNGNNTFVNYEYNSFGNVIRSTDVVGGVTQYSYDSTNTYAVNVVNALGHITYFTYDLGTGNLLTTTTNDITTSYAYDTHGRLTKEISPFDSTELPTKKYSYGPTGSAPVQVNVSLRTTANKSMDASYFYDGFANLVQVKSETDTQQIVKNLYYDSTFRAVAEDNPYLATKTGGLSTPASATPQTNYTYDALDRVVLVMNPDGTNKTTSFLKDNITDYDENGHRHRYTIDGLGRITVVREYNNDPHIGLAEEEYVTNYSYDANDNLLQIRDTYGNTFNFSYDTLSRKVGMQDPDMGAWNYTYDARNNLVRQVDARGQAITLSYDVLSRLSQKNSTDVNFTYKYDVQYEGTLTNLTQNGDYCKYTYDDRMRVISKEEGMNGININTSYLYDAQDRVISEEDPIGDLDYLYNKQGKVQTIPGFIVNSSYDAFGSLLNRTFANNVVATYTYHTQNHRLINITIPNVQRLNYSYDRVGNILQINDIQNNILHNMTYDNLDRLIEARIGADRYAYSYNAIGNMMNIVKNNASKKFVYGGRAHAPSSVIEGGVGADVYHVTELTGSKNRTVEFFLVNDQNTTLNNVNFSINFGNGISHSRNNSNITTSLLALVQNNYSVGGEYYINITSSHVNNTNYEGKASKFGVREFSLSIASSNVSSRNFSIVYGSDIADTVANVRWNCTTGNSSSSSQTFTSISSATNYFTYNFTSPGAKIVSCFTNGTDGNETKTITFVVNGLEVSNYDVLVANASRRIIGFTAQNNFYTLQTNISVQSEYANFSKFANITTGGSVLVFAEVNNSVGTTKSLIVRLTNGSESANYTSTYDIPSVKIDNYKRIDLSNVSKMYLFDVRNVWEASTLSWTFSDPSITNTTSIGHNKSLLIMIAYNYSQGEKTPTLNATITSYSSSIRDHFIVKPIALASYLTLSEGSRPVSELRIQNYLSTAQSVSWQLDTGVQNLTNTSSVNNSLLVLVQANQSSSGIYRTRANLSSGSYLDNRSGVLIS